MTAQTLDNLSTDELENLLNARKEKERNERESKRLSYETLRNETVVKLVSEASTLRNILLNFKRTAFGEIAAIHEVLKEYSARHEKGKGNFQISNEDNTMRIKFRNNEYGYFDERSTQAEKHILEFLNKRFGGDKDTRDLIGSFLERRKGHLDLNQVQKLYKYEDRWDDNNWKEGIKLLKESWTAGNTKWYAQFEVFINEEWKPIPLDFASLELNDLKGEAA